MRIGFCGQQPPAVSDLDLGDLFFYKGILGFFEPEAEPSRLRKPVFCCTMPEKNRIDRTAHGRQL